MVAKRLIRSFRNLNFLSFGLKDQIINNGIVEGLKGKYGF